MLGAFRTMVAGVGGVPGYAIGMASAYTMMSRFYGVKPSGRTLFGQPMPLGSSGVGILRWRAKLRRMLMTPAGSAAVDGVSSQSRSRLAVS